MHPKHLLEPEDLLLLKLWSLHAGGMSPGPLPFAGGAAEQPACVMASFAVIAAADAALRPKGKDDA